MKYYPVILHGGNEDFVRGELHVYDMEMLEALDNIEGHPHLYERRIMSVETKDGVKRAFVYVQVDPVLTEGKIEPVLDNDFLNWKGDEY
jgi:gamma-glutamylcyclotransferase (GGCT)/AIG2-like uncharacterized protein YtfP